MIDEAADKLDIERTQSAAEKERIRAMVQNHKEFQERAVRKHKAEEKERQVQETMAKLEVQKFIEAREQEKKAKQEEALKLLEEETPESLFLKNTAQVMQKNMAKIKAKSSWIPKEYLREDTAEEKEAKPYREVVVSGRKVVQVATCLSTDTIRSLKRMKYYAIKRLMKKRHAIMHARMKKHTQQKEQEPESVLISNKKIPKAPPLLVCARFRCTCACIF